MRYSGIPMATLRIAALLWLLLAAWALRGLLSLRDLGVLHGSFAGAVTGLSSLALGWLVALGLSFATSRPGLVSLGRVWARGLAIGVLVVAVLTLWAVYGGITRAGGRAPALYASLLASVVPAGIALMAARGIATDIVPKGTLLRWARGGLVAVVAGLTVALHLPLIGVKECYLTESSAIGDLRVFLSAEAVYQEASGGFFGSPDCLMAPTRCVAGYRPDAPTFLGAFAPVRCGYRFTFHPGRPAEDARGAPDARGNVREFAITATPTQVGRTGTRAFCADGTFVLRFSPDGRLPATRDAACPPDLPALP